MATYIAKEIKCATAYYKNGELTGYAQTNLQCTVGTNGYNEFYRSYINFDFSELPEGVDITSAYLKFFVTSKGSLVGNYIDKTAISIITSSWDENTLCYNTAPSFSSEAVTGFGIENEWTSVDITSLVKNRDLTNEKFYGLCLRGNEENCGACTWSFRNHYYTEDEALTPYIEINYEDIKMYKIGDNKARALANQVRRLKSSTDSMSVDAMITSLKTVQGSDVINKIIEGTLIELENDDVTSVRPYGFYKMSTLKSANCPNVETIGDYAFGETGLDNAEFPNAKSIGIYAFQGTSIIDVDFPSAETVGNYAFSGNPTTSISLPNATTIGNYAFNNNNSLSTVTLEKVETIGSYAFGDCDNLTQVNAPLCKTINNGAFFWCTKLESVYLPEVTTINSGTSSMAFGNTGLKTLNLPKVTHIGEGCFASCGSLESVDMPLLTTVPMQSFGCPNLKYINMPSLTSLGREGFNGSAITDINGENVNLPLLKSIGHWGFSNCKSLQTAYFPEVTSIGQSSLEYCTSLTRCEFLKPTQIYYQSFAGCTSLTTLILRNEAMSTLSYTNAFSNTPIASGTGYIYVPRDLVETYKTATNWSTYANQIRAIEDYPDVVDGKEVIREYVMDDTKKDEYTFNNEYVNTDDGYSLISEYTYESQEEEIDSGKMVSIEIKTDDKASIEGLVIE